MMPGDDGAWGVYAQDESHVSETTVALVEWLDESTSGRVVQGIPDGEGGRIVQVDTPDGTWSAAVDAGGNLLWSDPLPDDPWAIVGAVGDAGMAVENQEGTCTTCTAGIAWFVVAIAVVVVVAAGVALYTAMRDPPAGGRASPKPATQTSPSRSSSPSTRPHIDCGPRPEGDVRNDPELRRKTFEWMQCMAQANR